VVISIPFALNDNEDTLYLGYILQNFIQSLLDHPLTRFNTSPIIGSNLFYFLINPLSKAKNRIVWNYVFTTFDYPIISRHCTVVLEVII
jgi:hypothetical protein